MNLKMIVFVIARMLGVEGLLLLTPAVIAVLYGEEEVVFFLAVAALLGVIFLLLGRKRPEDTTIYAKEGFVIVAAAWIFWSLFGALPFYISGSIPSYVDAFFETVSGFTTTGSTILPDIDALPSSMIFWRALTHWVGGMGVLVFTMVVFPLGEKNSMYLMRAEIPGPEAGKLVPKARDTSRILYAMYFVLTLAEVILLLFGGMNLFDSVTHAFSTAGTGGFSGYNASVAHFDSAYIDGVITVFMILFGVNFNLYYFCLIRQFKEVWKNEELRAYLGIIAVTTAIVTVNILPIYETVGKAFRYASFQIASVITTTGFVTADYDLWPELSKCILILVMIIGAGAGSTGGGVKVSRFIILIKCVGREIKLMFHPKAVTVVKLNGKKVREETVRGVYVFFIAYILLMMGSILLVSLDNYDFESTFAAVATTMNNVGPGLNVSGPVENFSFFSAFSKIVLSLDMLAGRLEIFPFLMLFSPGLWKRKF